MLMMAQSQTDGTCVKVADIKMTVEELMDKLKDFPEDCEVVTHIKGKDRKYIVVSVEGIALDVSGVVGIEGEQK